MIDKNGTRQLCYVARVDDVKPIDGKDRVECAVVGGWTCMVPKGQFHPGDLGIYFEIDSKVDTNKEYFAFLEKRNGKIKTQKFKTPSGPFYSQGLLMAAEDFGWVLADGGIVKDNSGSVLTEGDFLTKELGVTYADAADNKRKANSVDKYKKMAQRHPNIFKKPFVKWLMRRTWGKKLMFLFFGKKKDKKGGWPAWVVKTDEERIQNLVGRIPEFQTEKWIPTEKIDGTSTTFTMKGYGRKREFYVCSRNVCFDKPDKNCFYETNVYTEMAEKYHMEDVLSKIMEDVDFDLEFVTIQGETYGEGVQKRDYSIKGHDFMAFNVIFGMSDGQTKRLNPGEMTNFLSKYNVPCVPFFQSISLPDTCEDILYLAHGESALDDKLREGLVFRSLDGKKSFKAVDNEFLMKYHNN